MFGFILGIGSWLLGFFNTAIDAVVASLVWAVGVLQAGVILIWNAIKDTIDLARTGFIKVWDFAGSLYDDVLKPAWEKFWSWFDKLRTWLNDTFGPLLDWLRKLREELLKFWANYVRPWLDFIDVTRRILRVLGNLGLAFAKKLDQELGDLENAIEAPFRFVLGKLNEIINVVNTIATAGGLLQQVALIRSLARDYQLVWKAITAPYDHPVDDGKKKATSAALLKESPAAVQAAIETYMTTGGGPYAATLDEMDVVWRQFFENGLPATTQ